MTEDDFLAKYVFYGIENLNNGEDVESIRHFSYSDLEKVMERAERNSISILGIEFWSDSKMLGVLFREDYGKEANWHRTAISSLDPDHVRQCSFVVTLMVPDAILLMHRNE